MKNFAISITFLFLFSVCLVSPSYGQAIWLSEQFEGAFPPTYWYTYTNHLVPCGVWGSNGSWPPNYTGGSGYSACALTGCVAGWNFYTELWFYNGLNWPKYSIVSFKGYGDFPLYGNCELQVCTGYEIITCETKLFLGQGPQTYQLDLSSVTGTDPFLKWVFHGSSDESEDHHDLCEIDDVLIDFISDLICTVCSSKQKISLLTGVIEPKVIDNLVNR